jgi:hypothetical protein
MSIFPFQTLYLKTQHHRQSLAHKLKSVSFLSDASFKKSAENPCIFFGEISEFDFNLEHISIKQKGVNFINGRFLGADNDMYIEVKMGAWQHKRIYLLLLTVFFGIMSFLIYYAAQNPHGFSTPEDYYHIHGFGTSTFAYNLTTPLALAMEAILLVILGILIVKSYRFNQLKKHTHDYLRGLWDAESVTLYEVPQILRR